MDNSQRPRMEPGSSRDTSSGVELDYSKFTFECFLFNFAVKKSPPPIF